MAGEPTSEPKPILWTELRLKEQSRRWWIRPFMRAEWATQWAAYMLGNWAFIKVVEYFGKLSVLVGVVVYFMEAPSRRNQAQYEAWRVITSNEGKRGSAGRIQALQDLNDDGVRLVGIDLHKAFLFGVRLYEAKLWSANFQDADLSVADLRYAELVRADLTNVILSEADLTGAYLTQAKLGGAFLRGVKLIGSGLEEADLHGAKLPWANLSKANLRKINLTKASLERAVLSGADLTEANLAGADLSESVGLSQAQIDSAIGDKDTKLPEGIVRPKAWD